MPFSHTDTLIQQNEEASWAGFVLDGNMAVEVNGNKVATLGAGAIIGGKNFKAKESVHRVYGKHCRLTFLLCHYILDCNYCYSEWSTVD